MIPRSQHLRTNQVRFLRDLKDLITSLGYRIQLFFATRIPGHVQPVGRPCGTWMHYAMRDVKDIGQQMGYRSLEWNWPKEAMNRPIWAGIVDGAKLF